MADYRKDVIERGDKASKNLGTLVKDTIGFSSQKIKKVDFAGGSVHLLFSGKHVDLVGFPISGNPAITDAYDSAREFVEASAQKAFSLGLKPVALTNILDMSKIDNEKTIPAVRQGLYDGAEMFGLWIANGETAGLGERVTVPFNISGFMLCYTFKGRFSYGIQQVEDTNVIVSPHNGLGAYLNSDGIGTKLEWQEMMNSLGFDPSRRMLQDGQAMLWDDAIKVNSQVIQDARVLELNRFDEEFLRRVQAEADYVSKRTGVPLLIKPSIVGERISGVGELNMNLSGTVVSLVSRDTISSLPTPQEGDYVMGFYDKHNRNFRSNGITDQRKILAQKRGPDWYKNDFGLLFAVTNPSTVFYDFFKKLLFHNLATSLGHFSGGAYDGKFAKVLGKHGLGADLRLDGHSFDNQETLAKWQMEKGKTLQDICAQQPYRLEAWITTKDPDSIKTIAKNHGYEAIVLGQTKKMENPELSITFDGVRRVSYTGR